jgi:hypothetical protein
MEPSQDDPLNDRDAPDHRKSADNDTQIKQSADRSEQTKTSAVKAKTREDSKSSTGDLQKERKKNDELRGENLQLRKDLHKVHKENIALTNEKQQDRELYEHLVDILFGPHAPGCKLPYDGRTTRTIDESMRPILKAVTEGCNARYRIWAEKKTAQKLEEQLQASQNQVESSQTHIESLQKQVESSQAHVDSLQKRMLACIDKVIAVSDDQFQQEFRTLAAVIKSLSRSIRVKEDMSIFETLKPHLLHKTVAEKQWASRACKKYYIEAWVWSVLIDRVFSSPFAISGQVGKELQTTWRHLFGEGFFESWPTPSSLCETWRYSSMEQLVSQVGRSAIMDGEVELSTESEGIQNLRDHVTKARRAVSNEIKSPLALISTRIDFSQLSAIIDKAFTLAMEMSLQRSRLQVVWPSAGDQYNKELMSCVSDLDGEEYDGGAVAFVVNPGLFKWGDANGKNLEEYYNVVPALVQVERPVGQTGGVVVIEE